PRHRRGGRPALRRGPLPQGRARPPAGSITAEPDGQLTPPTGADHRGRPLADGAVVVGAGAAVVVVVDGLGRVVVGAVEDEALGCDRVGPGEVGFGTRLDLAVVVEIRVAPLVATSARIPPTAGERALGGGVGGVGWAA